MKLLAHSFNSLFTTFEQSLWRSRCRQEKQAFKVNIKYSGLEARIYAKVNSNYSRVEFILLSFFSLFKDIQQINLKFLLLTLSKYLLTELFSECSSLSKKFQPKFTVSSNLNGNPQKRVLNLVKHQWRSFLQNQLTAKSCWLFSQKSPS